MRGRINRKGLYVFGAVLIAIVAGRTGRQSTRPHAISSSQSLPPMPDLVIIRDMNHERKVTLWRQGAVKKELPGDGWRLAASPDSRKVAIMCRDQPLTVISLDRERRLQVRGLKRAFSGGTMVWLSADSLLLNLDYGLQFWSLKTDQTPAMKHRLLRSDEGFSDIYKTLSPNMIRAGKTLWNRLEVRVLFDPNQYGSKFTDNWAATVETLGIAGWAPFNVYEIINKVQLDRCDLRVC